MFAIFLPEGPLQATSVHVVHPSADPITAVHLHSPPLQLCCAADTARLPSSPRHAKMCESDFRGFQELSRSCCPLEWVDTCLYLRTSLHGGDSSYKIKHHRNQVTLWIL